MLRAAANGRTLGTKRQSTRVAVFCGLGGLLSKWRSAAPFIRVPNVRNEASRRAVVARQLWGPLPAVRRGRHKVLTIEVTAINGARPPVPMSAQFDQTGGSIGRDASCTLVLPDPEKRISRRHAVIVFAAGTFRLRNQGSAIAVLLNGQPVDYGAEVPLASGDRIEIGEFALRVQPAMATAAPALAASMPRPAVQPNDILADFGPSASTSDPFADLIPVSRSAAVPPPTAPPPRPAAPSRAAPPPAQGAIPDDFDPFGDLPPAAVPVPPPLGGAGRGDFDDLVPPQQGRVDELFGLRAGDPFPPGHPLGAPSASTTPGPPGIDDLLTPGAPSSRATGSFAPAQRDDAPELNSPMRLPDVRAEPAASPPTTRSASLSPPPPPQAPEHVAHRELSDEGPGTVGGIRLSWDQGVEDGIFDGTKTAVIGGMTPDRRHGERRRSIPAEAPAAKSSSASVEESSAAAQALARALLDGLGLERWPEERKVDADLMRRLGGLLRVAIQGTIDLLRTRAVIKSEVQAQMTMIVSRDNNPLKFSPNAEAALAHLLGPAQRGFMSGNAAMEDAYRDLVAHQFGFTAGTRAALTDVLKRFDPATLEARLASKSVLDALVPIHRKAKLWDLFTERYAQITAEAEDDFQRLLGKEFLKAYEAQVAKMTAPERKPES